MKQLAWRALLVATLLLLASVERDALAFDG